MHTHKSESEELIVKPPIKDTHISPHTKDKITFERRQPPYKGLGPEHVHDSEFYRQDLRNY